MSELILGLLGKGSVGIVVLIVLAAGWLLDRALKRRTSLSTDLRKDLIAAKKENRDLEALVDQERARRRAAEDELWALRHGAPPPHPPPALGSSSGGG